LKYERRAGKALTADESELVRRAVAEISEGLAVRRAVATEGLSEAAEAFWVLAKLAPDQVRSFFQRPTEETSVYNLARIAAAGPGVLEQLPSHVRSTLSDLIADAGVRDPAAAASQQDAGELLKKVAFFGEKTGASAQVARLRMVASYAPERLEEAALAHPRDAGIFLERMRLLDDASRPPGATELLRSLREDPALAGALGHMRSGLERAPIDKDTTVNAITFTSRESPASAIWLATIARREPELAMRWFGSQMATYKTYRLLKSPVAEASPEFRYLKEAMQSPECEDVWNHLAERGEAAAMEDAERRVRGVVEQYARGIDGVPGEFAVGLLESVASVFPEHVATLLASEPELRIKVRDMLADPRGSGSEVMERVQRALEPAQAIDVDPASIPELGRWDVRRAVAALERGEVGAEAAAVIGRAADRAPELLVEALGLDDAPKRAAYMLGELIALPEHGYLAELVMGSGVGAAVQEAAGSTRFEDLVSDPRVVERAIRTLARSDAGSEEFARAADTLRAATDCDPDIVRAELDTLRFSVDAIERKLADLEVGDPEGAPPESAGVVRRSLDHLYVVEPLPMEDDGAAAEAQLRELLGDAGGLDDPDRDDGTDLGEPDDGSGGVGPRGGPHFGGPPPSPAAAVEPTDEFSHREAATPWRSTAPAPAATFAAPPPMEVEELSDLDESAAAGARVVRAGTTLSTEELRGSVDEPATPALDGSDPVLDEPSLSYI